MYGKATGRQLRRSTGHGRARGWSRFAAPLGTLLALLALLLGASPVSTSAVAAEAGLSPAERATVAMNYGKLPLAFEANAGQANPAIRFLTHGRAFSLALAPDALTLVVGNRQATTAGNAPAHVRASASGSATAALRFGFVGANPAAMPVAEQPLPGSSTTSAVATTPRAC